MASRARVKHSGLQEGSFFLFCCQWKHHHGFAVDAVLAAGELIYPSPTYAILNDYLQRIKPGWLDPYPACKLALWQTKRGFEKYELSAGLRIHGIH